MTNKLVETIGWTYTKWHTNWVLPERKIEKQRVKKSINISTYNYAFMRLNMTNKYLSSQKATEKIKIAIIGGM